eukprot:TRINITY_DN9050_c0_g1_i1.p1 TRINITY_DN9050_c0_g1~~TRINITY_DN9050_c0_g1_i1.p1  ORF type:complete len:456 (+),score=57.80 TRINITY_DN9050_c0_g1_i1:194-1561(+)
MYKNQLQELAQRSCFNLPAYACIREGPDHAPRFKATVTFNGEVFESPTYCSTLRQAEHAAAEVALNTLSRRGPSQSLAARILDETGVCKNLLQETAQRAGVSLPVYTTTRSGPGHLPVFTCTVEVAGMIFSGEAAKTKKQAEKNAALTAWSALKQFASQTRSSSQAVESEVSEEQEQNTIARALAYVHSKEDKPTSIGADCPPLQQLGPWQHQLPPKIASPRVKVVSIHDSVQSGNVRHYRTTRWSPGDLVTDPGLAHKAAVNQQHSKMMARTGPSCQAIVARPQYTSVSGSAVSLTREAVGANRLLGRGSSMAGRSLETRGSKDIVEAPFLIEEHCQDDEEWLQSDRRKMNAIGNSSEIKASNAGRQSTCGAYNPLLWSREASQVWNWQSHSLSSGQRGHIPYAGPSLAPPVCLRPMVAVHASPPASRVISEEAGNISTEGEQTTRQVLCQLKL